MASSCEILLGIDTNSREILSFVQVKFVWSHAMSLLDNTNLSKYERARKRPTYSSEILLCIRREWKGFLYKSERVWTWRLCLRKKTREERPVGNIFSDRARTNVAGKLIGRKLGGALRCLLMPLGPGQKQGPALGKYCTVPRGRIHLGPVPFSQDSPSLLPVLPIVWYFTLGTGSALRVIIGNLIQGLTYFSSY